MLQSAVPIILVSREPALNLTSSLLSLTHFRVTGTESETIALDAAAGSTQELTCPDASKYYFWKELSTTAQYYINPAGVSVAQACQWGDGSKPWGNFAPMNLGVGKTDGLTFLSIFPNAPTTTAKLEFNIKLTGDFGGSSCKYEDGEFYENGVLTQKSGCTVSFPSIPSNLILRVAKLNLGPTQIW